MLLASIGDLPLESWGVQSESVRTCYQPQYTARDRCHRKVDYVVGFSTDSWKNLYKKSATRFTNGYANHVDHPHTGTQVLGAGCEIKPKYGNLLEAEIQLGVWTAGIFSWAFEHRVGPDLPPPLVGFISVGESWEFYITYGVPTEVGEDNELPGLAEVHVWGPLSGLARRTSTEKTCTALGQTLRRVMEYICGDYIERLEASVIA